VSFTTVEKKRRDRLIQMVTKRPDLALGFEDEVWWSRTAQPQMHAWSDDKPVRLVEKAVPAKDPEGKAMACYGLYVPTANQMLLRFVRGRPVSLIWDNASWHVSQTVQEWIKAYNRQAKLKGGCRVIVCRLPTKSPWLNPIEPKWVHGKRAVVEPARALSMTDLMQRVCAYYECELTDPIAQPEC
jgi:DDE superfamily endonuclease